MRQRQSVSGAFLSPQRSPSGLPLSSYKPTLPTLLLLLLPTDPREEEHPDHSCLKHMNTHTHTHPEESALTISHPFPDSSATHLSFLPSLPPRNIHTTLNLFLLLLHQHTPTAYFTSFLLFLLLIPKSSIFNC